jgi:hypothetical protein
MPPYFNPTNIPFIYNYYKLFDGQYVATKGDKIIVWYNYDAIQTMLDTVNGLQNEYNRGMSKYGDIIEGFNNYITSLERWKECLVVDGKVDNITYKTKVKQIEIKTVRTLDYINIHNVILEQPKEHPIYGEYVGWSTSIITFSVITL